MYHLCFCLLGGHLVLGGHLGFGSHFGLFLIISHFVAISHSIQNEKIYKEPDFHKLSLPILTLKTFSQHFLEILANFKKFLFSSKMHKLLKNAPKIKNYTLFLKRKVWKIHICYYKFIWQKKLLNTKHSCKWP